MAIITLVSEKGGAGKSTLACHLAAEFQARGYRVLLVDADPQGSAVTWAEVAAEHENAVPDVVAVGDQIRQTLPGLAADRDLVLVDTAGRLGKRGMGALMVSDLALVPVQPSPTDFWGLTSTIDIVRTVQEVRPLHAAIAINGKERNSLNKGVRDGLAESGMQVLKSELGRRVDFAKAMATGQGVTGYAPKTTAALELSALADELISLLSAEEPSHAEAV